MPVSYLVVANLSRDSSGGGAVLISQNCLKLLPFLGRFCYVGFRLWIPNVPGAHTSVNFFWLFWTILGICVKNDFENLSHSGLGGFGNPLPHHQPKFWKKKTAGEHVVSGCVARCRTLLLWGWHLGHFWSGGRSWRSKPNRRSVVSPMTVNVVFFRAEWRQFTLESRQSSKTQRSLCACGCWKGGHIVLPSRSRCWLPKQLKWIKGSQSNSKNTSALMALQDCGFDSRREPTQYHTMQSSLWQSWCQPHSKKIWPKCSHNG